MVIPGTQYTGHSLEIAVLVVLSLGSIILCFIRTVSGRLGTRLQENPQLILQLVFMIQLTSRRILRE